MELLEKVSPNYITILEPLLYWRILSINDLYMMTSYDKTKGAFYKSIQRFEKLKLIESFKNSWNNEKYVYLLRDGLKLLGTEKALLPVNRDLRFHDSITSQIGLIFNNLHFVKSVLIDQNIQNHYPNLLNTPDIIIEGVHNKKFRIAIEVELSQKSSSRILNTFKNYSENSFFSAIIYITDKKFIFNAYQKLIEDKEETIKKDKFIFCYDPTIHRETKNILNAHTLHNGRSTTLKDLMEL